ncbi:MAG: DUF4177 domain-containing protein [Cohaesibacter sp.]|jgi:hypothetical protein|nr:DUF4177 domain-containing protein [Cohaesibacter sp.]
MKKGNRQVSPADYLVRTVTEIDQQIYTALQSMKAAKPDPKNPNSYIVTDVEKAKSQTIMPFILNEYGKEGWRLVAVNKMECFIFVRDLSKAPVAYKVLTPADLDKAAIKILQTDGAAQVVSDENNEARLEISDPQKAKIQSVLPKVLGALAEEGWELAAISGPQLHIFCRAA